MSNEQSKQDRFKRVAVARTNKIIKLVDLLGNCSNQNVYSYSDEEVRKIFQEIEKRLKKAKSKFDLKQKKDFQL
jgi:hypothetical protein